MAGLDPVMLRTCDYGVIAPGAASDPLWQTIETVSLAPRKYAAQKHLFPALFSTARLTSEQHGMLCEAAQLWTLDKATPFIGLLIRSDVPIHAYLGKALVISRPGHADRMLRLYDPRVYRHLRWILAPAQKASLMGPATVWLWPDRDGRWQTEQPSESVDPHLARHYTNEQLAQIERIEYVERAYLRLKDKAPHAVADEARAMQRLDDLLAKAMQQHGLYADRDLDLYVDHAITVHWHIHEHPEMQARLKGLAQGPSYRGICRDLDNTTLQRYARDMDDPHFRGRSATHS